MIFENVRADAARYLSKQKGIDKLYAGLLLLCTQEFLALLIFRFGKCVKGVKIPVISFLLKILYFVLNKIIVETCAGMWINIDSVIGKGCKFGHFGGIYIHGIIGENCDISQQVVIGSKGAFRGGGVPVIGNNVYIGSGAKIIGEVNVGNNVHIGANAVVVTDIPDYATAVGVPAKVVKVRA